MLADDKLQPKFSRQYVDCGSVIQNALEGYVADVGTKAFPSQAESFTIADEQYDEFIAGQIQLERESSAQVDAEVDRQLLERQRQAAEAELTRLSQQVEEVQALQARLLKQLL